MNKSFKLFTFISAIMLHSVNNVLVDPETNCKTLRRNLFKLINVYHELTDHDRDELFKYSMRKMAYDYLANVNFQDSTVNSKVFRLIEEINTHRGEYQAFKNHDDAKMQEKKSKLTEKKDKMQAEVQTLFDQLKAKMSSLNQSRATLESLKQAMERDDPFMVHQKLYQELSLLLLSMDNVTSDSEGFLGILDKFKVIDLAAFNQTVAPSIEALQQDFIFTTKLVELNEQTTKEFGFTMSPELTQDVKALTAKAKALKKDLNTKKKQLKGQITSLVEAHLGEMKQNENYLSFLRQIKVAQGLITEVQSHKFKHFDLYKKYLRLSHQVDIMSWQVVRVHPRDLITIPDKLYNLKELIEMNSGVVVDNTLDPELQGQVAAFYQANNTRVQQLQSKYDSYDANWQNLQALKEQEKQLDHIFAATLAALQSLQKKCFSNLELSVIFYFGSITQVVFSKKTFITVFLQQIEPNEQLMVVKQLMKDVQGRPLSDSTIVDLNGFVADGKNKAIQLYSTLMESEVGNIFIKQTDTKQKVKGIVANVLKYAGICGKTIAKKIAEIGIKELFVMIASAVATVVLVSFVPLLISLLILVVAGILLKLLSMWLGHLFKNYWPQIKLGISDLISRFSNDEIRTLDYNSILKQQESKLWDRLLVSKHAKSEASDAADRTQYFKNKFLEVIQMSIDQSTVDLMDIYDQLI